jgi:hypothetical protein
MFCDLLDSTGIAAKLDAEEWRDLVGAYLGTASVAVAEMGGKVAKKLGDGVMALFGYPVAPENDAERAVRAALSIQRALAELNRKNQGTGKPALSARIAIESRPVVVDVSGEISVTRRISRRRHSPTRVRSWPRRHSLRGLVLSHREHGAGERAVGLSQLIQYREVIGIDDRYQVAWGMSLRPVGVVIPAARDHGRQFAGTIGDTQRLVHDWPSHRRELLDFLLAQLHLVVDMRGVAQRS